MTGPTPKSALRDWKRGLHSADASHGQLRLDHAAAGKAAEITEPEKPLLVSTKRAKQLLDVKNTKFWKLVKTGKVRMADVGGRRQVVYASLEALARSTD